MLNESILDSTKIAVNITPQDTSFDNRLISIINANFARLRQMGVGPAEGFGIEGQCECWGEFYGDKRLSQVEAYMYDKTRLIFDPPTSSAAITALNALLAETEWTLMATAEEIKMEQESTYEN